MASSAELDSATCEEFIDPNEPESKLNVEKPSLSFADKYAPKKTTTTRCKCSRRIARKLTIKDMMEQRLKDRDIALMYKHKLDVLLKNVQHLKVLRNQLQGRQLVCHQMRPLASHLPDPGLKRLRVPANKAWNWDKCKTVPRGWRPGAIPPAIRRMMAQFQCNQASPHCGGICLRHNPASDVFTITSRCCADATTPCPPEHVHLRTTAYPVRLCIDQQPDCDDLRVAMRPPPALRCKKGGSSRLNAETQCEKGDWVDKSGEEVAEGDEGENGDKCKNGKNGKKGKKVTKDGKKPAKGGKKASKGVKKESKNKSDKTKDGKTGKTK